MKLRKIIELGSVLCLLALKVIIDYKTDYSIIVFAATTFGLISLSATSVIFIDNYYTNKEIKANKSQFTYKQIKAGQKKYSKYRDS